MAVLVVGRRKQLWSEKYKTTGHGSLIVTNLQGRITFVSEPVTGNRHDMAKLDGSDVEKILKKAGGVRVHRNRLHNYSDPQAAMPPAVQWKHEWKQSDECFPRASRAGCRHLEDMADPLHRLPSAADHL
jgi:hypothetical protein